MFFGVLPGFSASSRIVTTSSSPFASAASASAPHTARSPASRRPSPAASPRWRSRHPPRRALRARQSTSAHCTYAMPRPGTARVSATVASGSVPSAINKPRARVALGQGVRGARGSRPGVRARRSAKKQAADWCRSPPVLHASSSPSIAEHDGMTPPPRARVGVRGAKPRRRRRAVTASGGERLPVRRRRSRPSPRRRRRSRARGPRGARQLPPSR